MILDQYGKELDPKARPGDGRLTKWEPSDRPTADASRGLTPELVDRILTSANGGDIRDQSRLALEIEEKNWDIAQACQTRRLAVTGLPLIVEPADDTPRAKQIADDFEAVLRAPHFDQAEPGIETFEQALVHELMGALLPGFACLELIWGRGGKDLVGFAPIPQQHFTYINSEIPLLVTTNQPQGIALPANKFVYHRHRSRSGDATRGGLIRPLCWLDCFQRLGGFKDLLAFIERYGMPFLVAKVSDQAWQQDRTKIKYMIQNFGSSGGAVFTQAVETELLQAVNASGDVYFRLLDYCGAAITKVIQGQTATSGDSGGFSKGQPQENVRGDIIDSDAKQIGATVTARIAAPWTSYNYGPDASVPCVHLQIEEAADLKTDSEVLVNLSNAGFDADEDEVSLKFGYKLTRKAAPPPPPTGALPLGTPARGEPPPAPGNVTAAVSTGAAPVQTASDTIEGSGESRLLGGGRGAEPRAVLQVTALAETALSAYLAGSGQDEWWGPLRVAIGAALSGEPSEAEFKARLARLTNALPGLLNDMDSTKFQATLANTIWTATAQAKAGRAAALARAE